MRALSDGRRVCEQNRTDRHSHAIEHVNVLKQLQAAVVDSSLLTRAGDAGDGADVVGFLPSTKTDGVFAMYRVDNAVATYTFDVTG